MSLRPSSLPKLAACPCFEANPNAGPAAERGSALDTIFRGRVQGALDQPELFYQPTSSDLAAVDWAVNMVRALAGGSTLLVRENECRVQVPGMDKPGTADAILPQKFAHADLKTGLKRNYREQMAAYALGLMEQYFAPEWTAHLLFCDQREVVTLRFTYDEAKQIVSEVIAQFDDPEKQPAPCEYCGWCAKSETCTARVGAAETAMTITQPGFDFASVLRDNEKLGRFLVACSVLDDFRSHAEDVAKERLQAGEPVLGWKLNNRRGPEFINHDDVGRFVPQFGFAAVLAAYGNLSAKKFREVWEAKSDKPFPEELIKHGKATVSLRQTSHQSNPSKQE